MGANLGLEHHFAAFEPRPRSSRRDEVRYPSAVGPATIADAWIDPNLSDEHVNRGNEVGVQLLGTHPSYKLVPGGAIPPMFDEDSPVFQRATMIGHTVWVTPNHPDERWPAGEFVTQSKQDTGLPMWTEANRSIENTDVVLWYVFGIHHITRPEDWPIMPADVVSFWLKPFGFFDRTPALDVAPTPAKCCR